MAAALTPPLPPSVERMTPQQLSALSLAQERWIAVEAGAGAGKTSVLASRVLLLLERGVDLSKIVAITFTRKAAQEMSARVLEMLSARIRQLQDFAREHQGAGKSLSEVQAWLQNLLAAREHFSSHRITTIDAFCRTSLASHTLEAGLEPGFGMLDEHESKRALDDTLEHLVLELSNALSRQRQGELLEPALQQAAHAFSYLNDVLNASGVTQVLKGALLAREDFEAALSHYPDLNTDAGVQHYLACMQEAADFVWQEFKLEFADQVALVRSVCEEVLADVPDNARALAMLALFEAMEKDALKPEHFALTQTGKGKPWADREISFPDTTAVKKAIEAAWNQRTLSTLLEEQSARALAATDTLLKLLVERYQERKRGNLDFADLKRSFSRFIQSDAHAQQIAGGIDYLMIDEFQDTDPLQWKIFTRLVDIRSEINLFVVGDEKQSIYRFRGADVSLFEAARQRVRQHNKAAGALGRALHPYSGEPVQPADAKPGTLAHAGDQADHGVIHLTGNFRTAPALLELGNAIFEDVFSLRGQDGEQERPLKSFDARPAAMTPGLTREDGLGRLDVVPLPPREPSGAAASAESSDGDEGMSFDPTKHEAQAIRCALYIREELHERCGIPFEEMAILLRTRTPLGVLKAALAARGVPHCVPDGRSLMQTQECYDLWALAAGLSEPEDDLATAALLRSPMVGLSDDGMTTLVRAWERDQEGMGKRRVSLHEIWMRADSWPRSELGQDDLALLERSHEWYQRVRSQVGYVAMRDVLSESMLAAGAWAHGMDAAKEQRAANIAALLDLADGYEAEHGPSMAGFAELLWQRIHSGMDESEGMPESSGSGVRIMTIHASKGKEFEAVVLPFLDAGSGGFSDPLVIEAGAAAGKHAYGSRPLIAVSTKDFSSMDGTKGRLVASDALRKMNREEERAELRRLCYVAFTRARSRLALITQTTQPKNPKPFTCEKASTFDALMAASAALPLLAETYQEDAEQIAAGFQARLEARGITIESALFEDSMPDAELRFFSAPQDTSQSLDSSESVLSLTAHLRQAAHHTTQGVELPEHDLRYAEALSAPPSLYRVAASRASKGDALPVELGVVSANLPAGTSARFGEVVHAMLERYARGERSPDWARLAQEEAQRLGLVAGSTRASDEAEQELEIGLIQTASEHAQRAADSLGALPVQDRLGVEMELGFLLAERYVSAKPDLVFEYQSDCWRIVDYKTGDMSASSAQLELYAIGLRRYLDAAGAPAKQIETYLLSTLSGAVVPLETYDAEALDALEAEWEQELQAS